MRTVYCTVFHRNYSWGPLKSTRIEMIKTAIVVAIFIIEHIDFNRFSDIFAIVDFNHFNARRH